MMENSGTSVNKVDDDHVSSSNNNNGKTTEDFPEESSWTFYLQDYFLCDHQHHGGHHHDYDNSCEKSPSDAFSSAAAPTGKAPDHHDIDENDDHQAAAAAVVLFTSSGKSSICSSKNLSFKRRKATSAGLPLNHIDLDLEDTASSPVNSPKVSYINELTHTQNEKDNIAVSEANICTNNGAAEAFGCSSTAEEQKNIIQSDQLKKRGLCLVPVSMLTNYIG